jgi:CRISPR-associated protein Csx17
MLHDIVLNGCAPIPLIYYLKALGIFRLVAEQYDPQVRAVWRGDAFMLETAKTPDELVAFFLYDYSPTPVVAPWNGSSGFYPKDKNQRVMLEALCRIPAQRLANYHDTITTAREIVGERTEQPKEEEKKEMLRHARRIFSDRAVQWLDAVYVLGESTLGYPPLLGSGGNDGHFEFTINFVARLLSVLPEAIRQEVDEQWQQHVQGRVTEARLARLRKQLTQQSEEQIKQSTYQLRAALFRDCIATLESATIGQFYPAGAGGVNASEGVSGGSFVNPWDFILAIEGTMLLASATVRQLAAGARSWASFPFTTRNSIVGYGTASTNEKMRAEMWLPLWLRPASFAEVAHIFSEGRIQFSGAQKRIARTGFDFARAVAELGVDRGIDAFQRYGFIERYGRTNFAVPLGRFAVRERPQATLIYEFDRWFETLRRATSDVKRTPSRFIHALTHIEEASFQLCASGQRVDLQATLIALGAAETELARSSRFRAEHKGLVLRPLAGLSERWVTEGDDQSSEFELAAALASVAGEGHRDAFRTHLEPVAITGAQVTWTHDDTSTIWGAGTLTDNLAAVLHRRSIDARAAGSSHPELTSRRYASLDTIDAFLRQETDDERLEALLRGLALINWSRSSIRLPRTSFLVPPTLPRAYALLKLLFLPGGALKDHTRTEPLTIRHEPMLVPLLRAGRVTEALEIADKRLRICGLMPLTCQFHVAPDEGVRLAASLLIPIATPAINSLAALVLRPVRPEM